MTNLCVFVFWAFRRRRPGSREWSRCRCTAFRFAVSTLRASIPNAFALCASRGAPCTPWLRFMSSRLQNFPSPRQGATLQILPPDPPSSSGKRYGSAPRSRLRHHRGLRASRYLRRGRRYGSEPISASCSKLQEVQIGKGRRGLRCVRDRGFATVARVSDVSPSLLTSKRGAAPLALPGRELRPLHPLFSLAAGQEGKGFPFPSGL